MTLGLELEAAPAVLLGYERTVDRRLVHRTAVSEVFVTDLAAQDADRFLAAAQLPLCHGYYSDHRRPVALHDPLLLLEACRQASTYGAHQYLDLPRETAFLVNDWSLSLTDLDATRVGDTPGSLVLEETVHRTADRRGRLKGLRFELTLTLDGRPIGTGGIGVSCLPTHQYEGLRHLQRTGPPPITSDLGGTDRSGLVPASRVGRHSPENVVLADVRTDTQPGRERLTARLAPSLRNRGLFDHSYDHYPAMVLMEAARQAALLLPHGGPAADAPSAAVSALEGSFSRFVELDEPVVLTAERIRVPSGASSVRVRFEQQGATVAETAVALTPIEPR